MKRLTLEEKQEFIAKADKLKAQGISAWAAAKQLGLKHQEDIYRFRKQVESHSNGQVRQVKAVDFDDVKLLKARCRRLEAIVIEQTLDIHTLKEYNSR